MDNSFSTSVSHWQGVDEVPTVNSKNLIESGGVSRVIGNEIIEKITVTQGGVLSRQFYYPAKTGDKVCITIKSLGAALGYTIIRDENNHVLATFTLAANASVKKEFTLEYDILRLVFYSESIITTGDFSIDVSMANSVFCKLENIDSQVQTIDVTPLESDGDTIATFKKGNTTKQIKSGLSKQFIQLEVGKNVISILTCTQGVTLSKSISFPCSTGDVLKINIQSLGAALGYTIIKDNNNNVLMAFSLAVDATKDKELVLENGITRLDVYTENVQTSGDLNLEFIRYGELYQSVLENTKRLDADEVSLNRIKLNKNFLRGLIRNVLCIGDSVTHGLVSDYPHTGYNTNLVSYPRFLQQISGWSITNAGHSSWNADEWFTQWINNYTYTDYDMALMEFGYNGELTDTLDTDCPLAATWVSGQSYSVGDYVTYNHLRYKCEIANSDVTFNISKWSAAYNEYANTHTGYYCKIIEAILNANPSLLFVLIIPARFFPTYGSTIVIRKIAERYGLMVINLYDSSLINLNDNKYHGYLDAEKQAQDIRDTTHFNLIGYCYKAELIYAQLLDLFHENTALLNLNTEERYMSISDSDYNKVTEGFLNPTV